MTSLQSFEARDLKKLTTLPETFFQGLRNLSTIFLAGASKLGAQKPGLPDGLFAGLVKLEVIEMQGCRFLNLPSMVDLKVRAGLCLARRLPCQRHKGARLTSSLCFFCL